MIIGTGDIASVVKPRMGALIFAAGVSNSSCTDFNEFNRERIMIERLSIEYPKLCLFYFSSIFADLYDTPYFRHKQKIEMRIDSLFNNYNILRLGNISWGDNPNTFINYIKEKKKRGEPVEIKDELRYVITPQTLNLMIQSLPLAGQNVVNVFSTIGKVKDFI